jgi:hypothetical protein
MQCLTIMASRKRTPGRGTATRRDSRPRPQPSAPPQKLIRDQVAVRYCDGHEQKVRETLGTLGTLEVQPSWRLVILHRTPGIPGTKVRAALANLQVAKAIEFATPVLRDPASDTRQVITDEIVLRLKPGHARRTLAAVKAEHGLTIGKPNEFEPTQYIVKVPRASGTHTLDVARSLDKRDDVEFASPNFLTTIKR